MAHLKALEYFIRRKMEVPVNVIFVFEGDEECGSRGLEEFLAEHRTELQQIWCFSAMVQRILVDFLSCSGGKGRFVYSYYS